MLYTSAWDRLNNLTAIGGGVTRREAKYWHRQIYSGLVCGTTVFAHRESDL